MPRVLREQDSSLTTYPPQEVPIGTSVGECRSKFRHSHKISNEMACVVRGEAVADDYRLQEGDVAYFKKGSKKRGRPLVVVARN